ncbi:MAG: 3'-5' exonuclease, partial [Treponema sp.]|nr:3'-5' exonuclease [Treponema sp.]
MQHYNRILQDNRRLLKLLNSGAVITAFDTETTGIKAEDCTIIEIGAVKFNKDGELDRFSTLINPNLPIPQIITQITKITDSMVCSAPFIKEVLPRFIDFIGDSILMGHNVQFDLNFLNSECEKNGLPYVKNHALDTL